MIRSQKISIVGSEKKIIAGLLTLSVVLAIFYVYMVNSSIFNVIARKEAEEMITVTETEISSLVSEYMRLSQAINIDLAHELSFVEIPEGAIVAVEIHNVDTAVSIRR